MQLNGGRSFFFRSVSAGVVLALLLTTLSLALPDLQPQADAQVACTARFPSELSACIENYNAEAAATAHTISITADINVINQSALIPAINNPQSSPPTLTIEGGGRTVRLGSGITGDVLRMTAGDLVLREVTLEGAVENDGLDVAGGTAVVERSLFNNNLFGIFFGTSGASTVRDSTVFDSGIMGIGASASSSVTIERSTIVNSGTNAVQAFGTVQIQGSLLDDGCQGTSNIVDLGNNVADSDTCFGAGTAVANLGLAGGLVSGTLANNGCNAPCTRTVAIDVSSPATNANADCPEILVDQRGFPRGFRCDAGAFDIQQCGLIEVATEAQLASAIGCYNQRSQIPLQFSATIQLADTIVLTQPLPAIVGDGTVLAMNGRGHEIDASALPGSALTVLTGSAAFINFTVRGAGQAAIQSSALSTSLSRMTLTDNGIGFDVGADSAFVEFSTIAENGTGIRLGSLADARINDTTIVNNTGFGIDVDGTSLFESRIGGSLVAGNNGSESECNLTTPLASDGGNAISDASCIATGSLAGLDGTFAVSVAPNGCAEPCTPTISLNPDSPAIDVSAGCAGGFDQRGVVRTPGKCDAGSYEAADCDSSFVVDTAAELSAAIACYNVATFGSDVSIVLEGDIDVDQFTAIRPISNTRTPGPQLVIDGQGHRLSGDASIAMFRGDLHLDRIWLSPSSIFDAIEHLGGSLLLTRSTVSGAFTGVTTFGVPRIADSTFVGNSTGVFVSLGATAELERVTMIGNDVAVETDDSQAVVQGSFLADNGQNCRGQVSEVSDQGGNVADDDTCFGAATATAVPAATFAAELVANGCTDCAPTIALLPGSPAIDVNTVCTGQTDQRGVAREDGACDAGAFEASKLDADLDGFEGPLGDGSDCNDADPAINPDATEIANDGIDQDCDNEDLVVLCEGLPVTVNLNDAAPSSPTNGDDVILGTSGNDIIDGLGGNDTICAEGGDDVVTGGDGDDVIIGGNGNDRLDGNAGRDIIRGNAGNDVIFGGPGNDRLLGGIDDDQINGEDGNDFLGGFGGADTINGGPGNETIFGGFGADTINGDGGNDTIFGLIGNDTINGGTGDDELNGDRGNDTISGGPGNDVIRGGNANDILDGGAGDDSVNGGRADDQLSGGGGTNDTCVGNKEINGDTADSTCEVVFGVP
jgi:Ca2+-binding RTX toxin-like protein